MLTGALGILAHLYIIFWNDFADYRADTVNIDYAIFSGGSRVLPEGLLQPYQLLRAGSASAVGVLIVGGIFWVRGNSQVLFPLSACGLMLLSSYSMAPLKLNYRGGGEVLQALGCGLLLPAIGFSAQAGSTMLLPWLLLLPVFILSLASSIATSLPDERADTAASKRTLATFVGGLRAAIIAVSTGTIGVLLVPIVGEELTAILVWFGVVLPAVLIMGAGVLIPRLTLNRRLLTRFVAFVVLAGISQCCGFAMAATLSK